MSPAKKKLKKAKNVSQQAPGKHSKTADADRHRQVRKIASKTLTSLKSVTRKLEMLAAQSDRAPGFYDLDDASLEKLLAIRGAIRDAITEHKESTFREKSWAGSLNIDYRFNSDDLLDFLNEVARKLEPKYHFEPSFELSRKQLKDTLGHLLPVIAKITT